MRTHIISSVAALALLGACTTQASFEDSLQSWVGRSDTDLVAAKGAPTSTYETDGKRFLTYSRSHQGAFPGVAPSYTTSVVGNVAYSAPSGGLPSIPVTTDCSITYTVVSHTIMQWSYQGNYCYDF